MYSSIQKNGRKKLRRKKLESWKKKPSSIETDYGNKFINKISIAFLEFKTN